MAPEWRCTFLYEVLGSAEGFGGVGDGHVNVLDQWEDVQHVVRSNGSLALVVQTVVSESQLLQRRNVRFRQSTAFFIFVHILYRVLEYVCDIKMDMI